MPEDADARSIPGREIALLAAGSVALACAVFWPLPLNLMSVFPRDLGDPIVQAWQVAWGGHALASQPLDFFQANQFWPLRDTLAFSDALIGYAPAGLIGHGVEAATVRYNLLFLFAYALAFCGAYLLARELKLRPAAAAIAGAAFAYAPWRLEQDGHLHVISSGGIPLALFLLLRGYRRSCGWTVLAGWIVAAWQVSIGFTLGLQLLYLLLIAGAIAAIWVWRDRGKRIPTRGAILATIAGGLTLVVVAVGLSIPYQRVLSDHPEAERSIERVAKGSGPLAEFIAAPENNWIWGSVTKPIRENRLNSIPEQTLFPGLAILLLAIAGLTASVFPKRLRFGLAATALILMLLSLGVRETGIGRYLPYRAIYEFAPGWQGVRTPGRLNTLTSLALALLAAAGAQAAIQALTRRAPKLPPARVAAACSAVLLALIAIEFSGEVYPSAPKAPTGQVGIAQPQLHLPITIAANRRYVYWSTDGFPKIVNGRASIDPAEFKAVTREAASFPSGESIAALRRRGIRSVVLHPYLLPGTAWEGADREPSPSGASRRVAGDLIVYDLSAVNSGER